MKLVWLQFSKKRRNVEEKVDNVSKDNNNRMNSIQKYRTKWQLSTFQYLRNPIERCFFHVKIGKETIRELGNDVKIRFLSVSPPPPLTSATIVIKIHSGEIFVKHEYTDGTQSMDILKYT